MATRTPEEIRASTEALIREKDALDDSIESKTREAEIERDLAKLQLERGKYYSLAPDRIKALADAVEDKTRKVKEATEAEKEHNEQVEKATGLQSSFSSALQNSIKSLTGVEDASNTLIGSFSNLLVNTEDNTEANAAFRETLKKTFTLVNVGVSITRKFAESTFTVAQEIDSGTASFNKASGAGGIYNQQIMAAEKNNRQFALSIEDIAEARIGLADGLSGFAVLQAEEQDRLIELSAQFTRVGVSTADFVGILETGTRVLGLNTRQVREAAEEIRSFGQSIGVTTSKIMSEFNAALPALASFGAEATNIFKGLQLISQETGLATGELTSFADQFMSIENTARAVAGVQAVVGNIGIDQLTLLQKANEGQDAVIEYFRGALLKRGGYEQLNRLQKAALATQLNIDEATLAGLMNTNEAIKERSELETEFNEALEASKSLGESLQVLFKQTAIAIQPLVKLLQGVVDKLASLLGGTSSFIKGALALGAASGAALLTASKLTLGTSLNPIKAFIVGSLPGVGGAGGGTVLAGKTATTLVGGSLVATSALDEGSGFSLGNFLTGVAGGAFLGSQYGGIKGAIIGGIGGGVISLFDNGGLTGGEIPGLIKKDELVVAPKIDSPPVQVVADAVASKIAATTVMASSPNIAISIGGEQIKDFITKTQNTNLGRAPNIRPAAGGVT